MGKCIFTFFGTFGTLRDIWAGRVSSLSETSCVPVLSSLEVTIFTKIFLHILISIQVALHLLFGQSGSAVSISTLSLTP
jgi:hypothetical protein